jgi:NAD(P)-dependent dehydrogenase (short-subunit alcohol dehydrogenase family)
MGNLPGTRVLVTGATSGLGRAMAEALAEAGARVAITSQDRLRANDSVRDRGWGVLAWPVSAGWWLAAGGPVGDQPGDRQVGLGVILPPPDPALQRPPLLVLGVGMLDTDPLRRLLRARPLPGGQFLG